MAVEIPTTCYAVAAERSIWPSKARPKSQLWRGMHKYILIDNIDVNVFVTYLYECC